MKSTPRLLPTLHAGVGYSWWPAGRFERPPAGPPDRRRPFRGEHMPGPRPVDPLRQLYGIFLSDLRRPHDVLVGGAATRQSGRNKGRELNPQAVAERGPNAPLYYVLKRAEK